MRSPERSNSGVGLFINQATFNNTGKAINKLNSLNHRLSVTPAVLLVSTGIIIVFIDNSTPPDVTFGRAFGRAFGFLSVNLLVKFMA